jgi:cell division protein FtsN
VRVGPYATRAQADAAAKKIQGLKLAAIVFKH